MIISLKYIPLGDSAIIIKTGNEISIEQNLLVLKLLKRIENESIDGVVDFIPSYNELTICYDPLIISLRRLLDVLHTLAIALDEIELPQPQLVCVPVVYGGDFGPDLAEVAKKNQLTEDDVIAIHSSVDYPIYMLGFTPGFCYLGDMDERIITPRKSTPRLKIPPGSVGIADKQTGIYPVESPGGWQIIGQTPILLFDPERNPVFLFKPGDFIRFVPVSKAEFEKIKQECYSGVFNINALIVR